MKYGFGIDVGGTTIKCGLFSTESEELLEKIKFIASNNKRSANKEIEFILENDATRITRESYRTWLKLS